MNVVNKLSFQGRNNFLCNIKRCSRCWGGGIGCWECGENQIVLRDLNNPANFAAFEKQENGTYIFNAQNNQFYIFSRIDKNDLMYFAHNKLNNPKRLSWPIQS